MWFWISKVIGELFNYRLIYIIEVFIGGYIVIIDWENNDWRRRYMYIGIIKKLFYFYWWDIVEFYYCIVNKNIFLLNCL